MVLVLILDHVTFNIVELQGFIISVRIKCI